MSPFYKFLSVITLLGIVTFSGTVTVSANDQATATATSSGYSVLKIFLEDEQHLTTIRFTKMFITFSGISDSSATLIDDIANSSEQALDELEALAKNQPRIEIEAFSDETIAKATLDAMRMTTAKNFLFEADGFEKNLLLSQMKVLPVISHLAEQLEKKETDPERRAWLNELARRYEDYYKIVNDRITVTANDA